MKVEEMLSLKVEPIAAIVLNIHVHVLLKICEGSLLYTPYRKKLKTCISKWTAQIFNQISAFNFRINEEHFKPDIIFFIGETLIFGKKKSQLSGISQNLFSYH